MRYYKTRVTLRTDGNPLATKIEKHGQWIFIDDGSVRWGFKVRMGFNWKKFKENFKNGTVNIEFKNKLQNRYYGKDYLRRAIRLGRPSVTDNFPRIRYV